MKNTLIFVFIVVVLLGVYFLYQKGILFRTDVVTNDVITTPSYVKNVSVNSGDILSGVVTVTGSVKHMYFEGSFPVYLTDNSGVTVVSFVAQAQGDWMVDDFVPFSFDFVTTSVPNGMYVMNFQQDDPSGGESGLPLKQFSVPIQISN